jgi:hypothetical protein
MKLLFRQLMLSLVVLAAPAYAEEAAVSTAALVKVPDSSGLTMPALSFTATPGDALDYDKFFFFHRVETSFADAYSDIKECDALSSGISIYMGGGSAAMSAAMTQYGVGAGAIGGAIGGLIADAIFGSAERRKTRRTNMRNCMGFKGYQRYGLNRDLWEKFNFEEGMGRKADTVRESAMQLQALVASGPKPSSSELGL